MAHVRIEFTVEPFVDGHPGPHVAAAIGAVEARGWPSTSARSAPPPMRRPTTWGPSCPRWCRPRWTTARRGLAVQVERSEAAAG